MNASSSLRILYLLAEDHGRLRRHLLGMSDSLAVDRSAAFEELVGILVAHELAEQEVVYPAVRGNWPVGGANVEALVREAAAAGELPVKMEAVDPAQPEFSAWLSQLREVVTGHTREEERNVFPLLSSFDDEQALEQMAVRYCEAKDRVMPQLARPDGRRGRGGQPASSGGRRSRGGLLFTTASAARAAHSPSYAGGT